ncbi:unnamed protein product, partial [Polarella glacialis]
GTGACEKSTGYCNYMNRPNGYTCDDTVFWTLDDGCQDGRCEGTADYCLGYNVTCKPLNSCLTVGTCHTMSGRCTYDQRPDETLCDDGRDWTVEDMCQAGICVGRPVDLCELFAVECTAPSACYDAGKCDRRTGKCSQPEATMEMRPCTDGDKTTVNDTCVDGVCLGQLIGGFAAYKFQTLGVGECSDRQGRRMARYTGDQVDETACETLCRGDPQCVAFSFAYPSCSIYGTVRTRAPAGFSFQAGTDPVGVVVETAVMEITGQWASVCRKKGLVTAEISTEGNVQVATEDFFDPVRLSAFFVVLLCCFFALPLSMWCRRNFCCCIGRRVQEDFIHRVTQEPKTLSESPWQGNAALEGPDANEVFEDYPDHLRDAGQVSEEE